MLLLLVIPVLKLALHLAFAGRYGIFRDELYYLACGEHLAWGYVDQPPLIAAIAAFERALFGESLLGLRLLPALAGAGVVLLAGVIARDLGGGRAARLFAQLAALISPLYLTIHHFLSMNVFEHLFWALAAWGVVRIVRDARPRLWPWVGLAIGVGLENKHSIAFLAVALVVGLAATRERRLLWSGWFLLAAAIAAALAAPHAIWQWQHGFPMLELLRNGQLHKNAPFSPLGFVLAQLLENHPLNAPVWLGGWIWLARSRFRALAIAYVALLAMMIALRAKGYYLAPIYTLLYAAGGVAIERVVRRAWLRVGIAVLMLAGGALTLPYAVPVLSEESFIAYAKAVKLVPPPTERHEMGPLPQLYADMHGWPEMVAKVAEVYHALPPEDRARAAIFTSNYGEAGAIDFFGPKLGLPKAISGHNAYWMWGPRGASGEVLIVVGESREDVEQGFAEVTEAARVHHPYAMPYENAEPIFVGRRPRAPVAEMWARAKKFI